MPPSADMHAINVRHVVGGRAEQRVIMRPRCVQQKAVALESRGIEIVLSLAETGEIKLQAIDRRDGSAVEEATFFDSPRNIERFDYLVQSAHSKICPGAISWS